MTTGLLLDTHVLFWYATGDQRLPAALQERLQNEPNPLTVSAVSCQDRRSPAASRRTVGPQAH